MDNTPVICWNDDSPIWKSLRFGKSSEYVIEMVLLDKSKEEIELKALLPILNVMSWFIANDYSSKKRDTCN